jgi:phospholipase C
MGDGPETTAGITLRRVLRDAGVAGLGLTALGGGLDGLLSKAMAAAPKAGSLKDIDHVVILIQENRSFDHYFGTLSGVRGLGDSRGRAAFTQRDAGGHKVQPFRLPKACLPDITHDWAPQPAHGVGRRPDGRLRARPRGRRRIQYGDRDDGRLQALAPPFLLLACRCLHDLRRVPLLGDRSHRSEPVDVDVGVDRPGGIGRRTPLLETLVGSRKTMANRFTWTTMPERLHAHQVSWKVYTSPAAGVFDNVLTYFKLFTPGSKLAAAGLDPCIRLTSSPTWRPTGYPRSLGC